MEYKEKETVYETLPNEQHIIQLQTNEAGETLYEEEQLKALRYAIHKHLLNEQIAIFAKPYIPAAYMYLATWAFQDGQSSNEVRKELHMLSGLSLDTFGKLSLFDAYHGASPTIQYNAQERYLLYKAFANGLRTWEVAPLFSNEKTLAELTEELETLLQTRSKHLLQKIDERLETLLNEINVLTSKPLLSLC